jgi:tyrosyl-tRNA synthetase
MNTNEKIEMITRDLAEVINKEKLESILKKRDLVVYWGTAPTGRIHIGYLIPFSKIADLLETGAKVKILIADIHAFLDSQKTPEELLDMRSKYYEIAIKEALKALKVPVEKLEFVRGSSYQLSKEYTRDVYRFASITTIAEAKKAGAEVVKQDDNPRMAPMLYPLLQALDEEYLKVDAQFGGMDQRKIFVLAHEYLPKLGYEQRIHFMNPLMPGLTGDKMSSSVEASKIDLLDTPEQIKSKMQKAYCPEAVEGNGVLAFVKLVLFPYFERIKTTFKISRPEKFGGNLEFKTYKELEKGYAEKKLHPLDLKTAVASVLVDLLASVRNTFEKEGNKKLVNGAYKK